MATASLISLQEYLSSSYHPDCDYLDGRLGERHLGEFRHSFLQGLILLTFKAMGLRAYTELRCQVRPERFRVPDVLALRPGERRERRYKTSAPYIVVEVLSPEDTVREMQERIADYIGMGIPNIWVADPEALTVTAHGPLETHTLTDWVTTSDGTFSLDLIDIFRQMMEDEAE